MLDSSLSGHCFAQRGRRTIYSQFKVKNSTRIEFYSRLMINISCFFHRYHANQVFKPQIAQAIRIAHILSAYLQLHSPFSFSSVYNQDDSSRQKNFGSALKPDPQLEEYIIVGEIMSTLMANYPIH